MRVGSGGTCRSVFARSEEPAQFLGGLFPLPRRTKLKDTCKRTPPAVSRQDRLLKVGGVPVLSLKLFETLDRGEVGDRLFPQAALADSVGRVYSEISGGRGWRVVSVGGKDDYRGFGLGDCVLSRIAISQAAW